MKKLALLFYIFFLPMAIQAVTVTIDGLKYDLVKNTYAIVIGTDTKPSGNITIPASIVYEDITYSVTSIGDGAFYLCKDLTSIDIPNSVTSIGKQAFAGCSSLSSIEIPNGVTSIKYHSFENCSSLTSIDIPNSVTNIEEFAFSCCEGLTSVNIGNSLKSIGNCAFQGCSSLVSINIPNSVTSIGHFAFSGDSALTSITIPNNVKKIEMMTFHGCSSLSSAIIGNCVTEIGYNAFSNCTSLTSIAIPNSVKNIGDSAFEGCTGLISIDIPDNVASIGDKAFSDCSGLESVVIGNGISVVSSFSNCFNIKTISLGSKTSKIARDNFYNCKDLEVVICKANSVPAFESSSIVFNNCYIEYAKLIVPDESIEAYKAAAVWKDFGTIEGLSGNISQQEKCATPTIHYTNGQLTFECETEGVTFQATITSPDISSYSSSRTIDLSGTYYVKVYATKPRFDDSDIASAEISLLEGSSLAIKGDVNNDSYVNMTDVTEIINIILGKK